MNKNAILLPLLFCLTAHADFLCNGTFSNWVVPVSSGGGGGGGPCDGPNSNNDGIAIDDNTTSTPYPSTITVSGFSGTITKVTVSLCGLAHTFPSDINALLVSPSGTQVAVMFGASTGSSSDTVDLIFDDDASGPIPNADLASGTYQPTANNGVTMDPPAPGSHSTYHFTLSAFIGEDPNGDWNLWVEDHSSGDSGVLAGWSLNITAP